MWKLNSSISPNEIAISKCQVIIYTCKCNSALTDSLKVNLHTAYCNFRAYWKSNYTCFNFQAFRFLHSFKLLSPKATVLIILSICSQEKQKTKSSRGTTFRGHFRLHRQCFVSTHKSSSSHWKIQIVGHEFIITSSKTVI